MCIHNNLVYLYRPTFSDKNNCCKIVEHKSCSTSSWASLPATAAGAKEPAALGSGSCINREKNQLQRDFGFLDTRHRVLKESKYFGPNEIVYQLWKG